jgi:class 3 adenylate cyclase/tetratricopeptide (TPR) repeat protein
VVSKDDLIAEIWGGRIVSESALSTRINAARTAIGDNGDEQRLIRTLPRKGIRFVGVVREGKSVEETAAAPAVQEMQSPEPTTAPPWDKAPPAERRQLTVASCELLLGAGAARMDPEDLREIVQDYHGRVAQTVRRYNGFVANTVGNTALVYFGYPEAHEYDAEWAVRAGLQLIAVATVLKSPVSVRTRVGIASGLVVIGDLIGSGKAEMPVIVGETPNLATRLQALAEPNTVVVAESTRQLVGNLFKLENLGTKYLTGITEPVRAFAALGSSLVESRFEALRGSRMTVLVGREEELELLLRRWSRAKNGEGQVVLLSGEAGIGKSRLTAAMLERLATEPHTHLRYFCSPQHTDSAFYPIIGQLERAAGLTREDTTQAKLDKLATVLAQTSTSIEDAALFAEMLSLSNDRYYPASELTPQQRRQRTIEAIIAQLEALAHQNPLLMIFEDAHWTDPTSLEVFGRVVDRIRSLPVLLIVTLRPEFQPPWIERPHVTALTINRLAERDIGVMIDHIVGDKSLPTSILQDITERSDGVPLFVEEITKAVLEAKSEGYAQQTVSVVESRALTVPAGLQASLLARLDRLGPAKEIAKISAAIGREFSHALLAAVVNKPEAELGSALTRLIAAGLLFRQGVPPHATYLFKHALVQDVAYGTLLREPRRVLHARIAEALESQFPEIAESHPELLARHCTEAGLIEKAAGLWGKAGQQSLARSALLEAAEQLNRALGQIPALPATPALRREQIKLQVALAKALMHTQGYASSDTKVALDQARSLIERAEALGEPLEDPLLLFWIFHGFWVANFIAFNGDAVLELAVQFLALAEKQGATIPLMMGHRIMGSSLLFTGAIAESRAQYDQAIALYDPREHRPLATLSYRSLARWFLGHPEAALADADHALKNAREIRQATTLMVALNGTTMTRILCGNYAEANAVVDELVNFADEKGLLLWKAWGMMNQGWLMAVTGKASNAVKITTSAITTYRSTGATLFMPTYLSTLARAYSELGQFDDAWCCIGEAMTAVEITKERWHEAEVNRIAGEITLLSPEPDAPKAEAYFERALAVARGQQAKSWELRAAMSLARLWRDRGKPQQARELIAPVYDWFTEGFETLDLKQAKDLIDALT